MTIKEINSPEHQKHADGLEAAMEYRKVTYPNHYDPAPYMRRTRDPLVDVPYPPPGLLQSPNDPCGLVTLTTTRNSNPCPQDYPYTFLEKALGWAVLALFALVIACSRVYDISEVIHP